MSTHSILSSSKTLIAGIGYDPVIGPRSTGPQQPMNQPGNNSTVGNSGIAGSSTGLDGSRTSVMGSSGNLNPQLANSSYQKRGSVASTSSTMYDRNLHRSKHDISLSSLSFLFCETVSWCQNNSKSIGQLERKLSNLGYTIGLKYLELASLRENFANGNLTSSGKSNSSKREITILGILQFIHSIIWKSLFGKTADNLERSQDDPSQYMIIDNDPMMSRFISIPPEMDQLNVSSFVAGIVEGILDASYFTANVTAHSMPMENFPLRTVFVIKFSEKVARREQLRQIR